MPDVPTSARERATAELATLLARLGDRIRRHMHDVACHHDLTAPMAAVLREARQPQPMGVLADRLGIDASYVTALVDRLEELGLAERQPDPTDRRVRQVAVTDRGAAVHRELERGFTEALEVFGALDDAELAELVSLLRAALGEP